MTRVAHARSIVLLSAIGLTLAGCGGGGGSSQSLPAGPTAAPPVAQAKGNVSFVVTVPKASSPSGRTPKYVSPATQSMTVSVLQGTTQVVSETVGLTISSTGCASSLAGVTCTLQLSLNAGNYTASITTYDGANGTGNALSTAQSVAFTVVQSQNNQIPLSLSGIPVKILVSSAGANSVYVLAQDADGNFIVGSGAPVFTGAKTAGSTVATINQPTTAAPNTMSFALPSPAPSPGVETIGITASYPAGQTNACSATGAVCSLPSAVTASFTQTAFVGNYSGGNLLGFTLPLSNAAQPVSTLSLLGAYPMALDASGNLWAAGYPSGPLVEYTPPYTGSAAVSNANGLSTPYGIATAPNGDVFVANAGSPGSVSLYAPPYTSAPVSITNGVSEPYAVAVDANNNLYVGNYGNSLVLEFSPPYTGAPVSVALSSAPTALLVAGSKLFVGENADVDVFTLPVNGASTPAVTISSGIADAYGLALDSSNDLFVSNENGGGSSTGTVEEFKAPLSGGESPSATISFPLGSGYTSYAPYGIAFDAAGNLYVSNAEGGSNEGGLLEFSPPFSNTSTPAAGIESSNLNYPYYIEITSPQTLTVTP